MDRRQFLGAAGALSAVALAGCLGDDSEAEAYETFSADGYDIPLVPVDDAIDWYENDDAVFVDTRYEDDYEEERIAGAILSPAPDGADGDDPLADVPQDRRIVTYCTCPHSLAAYRGADLLEEGYEEVYALDEGLPGWIEQDHPVEGSEVA